MSKFNNSYINLRSQNAYDLKIIVINNDVILIKIESQFLKQMNSSNEFFACMQYRQQFDLNCKCRNNQLFFKCSVNQFIKKFECVILSIFSIEIICKKCVDDCFKDLFFFKNWRFRYFRNEFFFICC